MQVERKVFASSDKNAKLPQLYLQSSRALQLHMWVQLYNFELIQSILATDSWTFYLGIYECVRFKWTKPTLQRYYTSKHSFGFGQSFKFCLVLFGKNVISKLDIKS